MDFYLGEDLMELWMMIAGGAVLGYFIVMIWLGLGLANHMADTLDEINRKTK